MSHKLRTLLASAGQGGQWLLVPSGQGLERSFKFKTFAKTWVSPVPLPPSYPHVPCVG